MTSAPRRTARATSMPPVTPPAPLIRSGSPARTLSASTRTCSAVSAGTGNAAAASHLTPGGLDAQRHRRRGTYVPATGADQLIPVSHAGRPDLDKHLVPGQRPRLAHLNQINLGTHLANPGYLHLTPPNTGL